jgi:hypothetical protein
MAPQAGKSDSETLLSLLIDISARLGTVDAQVTMILAEHGRASDHRKEIYKAIEEARSRIAHVGTRCDVLDALKPHVEELTRLRQNATGAFWVIWPAIGIVGSLLSLVLAVFFKAIWGWLVAHIGWN